MAINDIHTKYPAEYKCDDGHFVRSKAEMLIDNWLFKNGHLHTYETAVHLSKTPTSQLYCDFYLPTLGLYIEYWGKDDERYNRRKRAKLEQYSDNELRVISLYDDDIKRLDDVLPKRFADGGDSCNCFIFDTCWLCESKTTCP